MFFFYFWLSDSCMYSQISNPFIPHAHKAGSMHVGFTCGLAVILWETTGSVKLHLMCFDGFMKITSNLISTWSKSFIGPISQSTSSTSCPLCRRHRVIWTKTTKSFSITYTIQTSLRGVSTNFILTSCIEYCIVLIVSKNPGHWSKT